MPKKLKLKFFAGLFKIHNGIILWFSIILASLDRNIVWMVFEFRLSWI